MFTDVVDLETGSEIYIIQMKLEGKIHVRQLYKSNSSCSLYENSLLSFTGNVDTQLFTCKGISRELC